jgi:hypothetical protein
MNPDVAPMMASIVLFIVTGAVILLRPITKRLGVYLEVLAEERRRTAVVEPADTQRIAALLEALDQRVARLEERQEFTDALLGDRQPRRLPENDSRLRQ